MLFAVTVTEGLTFSPNDLLLLFWFPRGVQAVHKRLLAESLVVFHDKRTTSRQLATQLLIRLVGRLAVVQGE